MFGSSPQMFPLLKPKALAGFLDDIRLPPEVPCGIDKNQDKQERCWLMAYKALASFNKAET